jgi:soluble lytic murein transglycosylase-like protein
MEWLQERQADALGIVSDISAIGRATAANPRELPKPQAALTYWLSRKYRVAPEPVSALVAEAYALGPRTKLDPPLILAVAAIESGFNPFAQSHAGAQGLMQVMTHVHTDKFDRFGGKLATFDPVSNLRVGAKVLQECIQRAGSVEGGLRFYVGAANLEEDGGYVEKVLAEYERLKQIAAGQTPVSAWPVLPAAS